MGFIKDKSELNIKIVDMLCITPYYDKYLLEALLKRNKNIEFVCISFHREPKYFKNNNILNRPGLLDIVAKLNIKNNSLRQGLKIIEFLINITAFRIKCYLKKPDIVHFQWLTLLTKSSLEKWLIQSLKRQKIKIVYTVHDLVPHDTGEEHLKKFCEIYNLVDLLICHTRDTKQKLAEKCNVPMDKINIIPHGPLFHDSNEGLDQKAAKALLKIPNDCVTVLLFGLIRPYKGTEFLLDVWKKVSESRDNVLLLLAGNGDQEYLSHLDAYIKRLNLSHKVQTVYKHIPVEELPIYHKAADILVYPYKSIYQSGALLTGMTYGKAIVATEVGGFKETIQHEINGVLVTYGEEEELLRALLRLIDEPETRQQLGNNALDTIKESYSWDLIADKTLDCYASACSRRV